LVPASQEAVCSIEFSQSVSYLVDWLGS
jgi:hypothetical protein